MAAPLIRVDVKDLERLAAWYDSAARRQIPFALSLAVNLTASDAQKRLRRELPDHFKIRSTWVAKGIRISKLNKKGDDPTAEVWTRDEYMERQVFGGLKKDQSSGGFVGVPIMARRPATQRTTRGRWPSAQAAQKEKYRIFKVQSGPSAGHTGLWRIRKNRTPRLQWLLETAVWVPVRWPFFETVEGVVDDRWAENVETAWNRALATAKPPIPGASTP